MSKETISYFFGGIVVALAMVFGYNQMVAPRDNAQLKSENALDSSENALPDEGPVNKPEAPASIENPPAKAVIQRPKPVAREVSPPQEDASPMHGDYEIPIETSKVETCWADYCPCDKSDPDYGYADISLCRKITMGMPVSDAEFDLGAMGRDARKALREDQERSGSYYDQ